MRPSHLRNVAARLEGAKGKAQGYQRGLCGGEPFGWYLPPRNFKGSRRWLRENSERRLAASLRIIHHAIIAGDAVERTLCPEASAFAIGKVWNQSWGERTAMRGRHKKVHLAASTEFILEIVCAGYEGIVTRHMLDIFRK